MKDKNGYTLSEVLACITIISLIIVFTVSIAVKTLDNSKKSISDVDKKIIVDAAKTYAEDLDKNEKSYFLLSNMNVGETIIHKDAEINGYSLKALIEANNTLPVKTSKLKELGYLDEKNDINCTINMEFKTSRQDGYIIIDEISAKLGDDCK